jgi:hypothetical protein
MFTDTILRWKNYIETVHKKYGLHPLQDGCKV